MPLQCNFAQERTKSHARLIFYPAVAGAARRPDALYRRGVIYCRPNAGWVKISLSNWTACRRPRGDTTPERLFRPFYAIFFPVADARAAQGERESARERERRKERGSGVEKPRLIAYRPFVSKVGLARPQFLRGRFVPRQTGIS